MCLNKFDDKGKKANLNLYGPDENYPHRRIELMYKPCTPVKLNPENKHLLQEECYVSWEDKDVFGKKLDEIKEWIGQPDLNIVYNHETVAMNQYGK